MQHTALGDPSVRLLRMYWESQHTDPEVWENGTVTTKEGNLVASLGEAMFGDAELGDRRRVKRLIEIFEEIRKHPGGTLPDKLKSPMDLKALYRWCACPDVTHRAVIEAMGRHVMRQLDSDVQTVLVLHDATELDYTSITSLAEQLGQIGKGLSRGYLCHNSLAVTEDGREILGLTNQILHRRDDVSEKETLPERRERESRESRLWLLGTAGLPSDRRLVDICDQGSDTFEFLEHEFRSGRRFVIRSKRQRCVYLGHEARGGRKTLAKQAACLPLLGERVLQIQSQKGKRRRRAREATLEVRGGEILIPRPHARYGNYEGKPMPMWAVRIYETKPPRGEDPLEWVLLTNEPITTYEDALRVVQWYESRWIVEEFHKAMKTACGIENMQFTATARLEPMVAVLSAVATTLLNLRGASRREDAKTRPATSVISVEYIRVLSGWRYGRVRDDLTIHEFFYALARLGGHQNRKNDKRPGWLVLWRGWTTLQAMLDGVDAIRRKKCG